MVILRPLQLSDLDFLYTLENNPENWKFGSERRYFSKEDLISYIKNAGEDIKEAKQYRFVIDNDGMPVGFIDLFDYTSVSAGVGLIIEQQHRRKGIAKEALNLLIEYANNTLNLGKLQCSIRKDNLASIQLFSRAGFFEVRRKEDIIFYQLNCA